MESYRTVALEVDHSIQVKIQEDTAEAIRIWIRDYVSRENDQVRRPHGTQQVCPFAATSMVRGELNVVVCPDLDGTDEEQLTWVALRHIESFPAEPAPFQETSSSAVLILAFPDLKDHLGHVLDSVTHELRSVALQKDLMLGQIHKNVPLRGVYNRSLEVFGPCELLKIRRIVLQDLVFFDRDAQQFQEYQRRFRRQFEQISSGLPNHLTERYRAAEARFAAPCDRNPDASSLKAWND